MSSRLILLMFAALAMLSGCSSARSFNRPLKTTLVTGPPAGYYQKFCVALQTVAKQRGVDIACLAVSNGSQDNVYKLEQGKADFALIQSDVAHRAWMGEYPFDEKQGRVRLVAPLFTERVHILVRPHQYLTSVAQLRSKSIWMGAKNSGSRFSAFTVLLAAGLPMKEVRAAASTSLDSRKAFALLRAEHENDNDAPLDAVIDSEVPSPKALSEILDSLGIKVEHMRVCRRSQRITFRMRPNVSANAGQGNKPAPTGPDEISVLLRPDLSITSAAELKDKKLRVPKRFSQRHAAALARLGPASLTREPDISRALMKLQRGQIDALVQPADLTPELIAAILRARHYEVLPLSLDPRTHGKRKLVAFLRPGLTLSSSSELADKKVWWDEADDALDEAISTALARKDQQGDHGLRAMQPVRNIDTHMALDLLAAGELDAVFQTTVAPNSGIAALVKKPSEISLLGIDWPMVEKLVADGSYVETSLQPSAYPDLDKGVYTVAVQTLLLSNLSDSKDDQFKVEAIARLLHDDRAAIENELRRLIPEADGSPTEPFALTLLGSPLKPQLSPYVHPSAGPFLVPPGNLRRGELTQMFVVIVSTLIFCAVFLAVEKKRRLSRRQTATVLLSAAFVLTWVVGAILLQGAEGDITQEFVSLVAAGKAIGLTVISHSHLPVKPPLPTTRSGQLDMDVVSWLMTLLVGIAVPLLKGMLRITKSPFAEREKLIPPSGPASDAHVGCPPVLVTR